ncbi:MAG: HesA/MoeB/ThiF family protein [bacterium]
MRTDGGRYVRQIAALGRDGHRRIRDAKVLVVGLGGLGCPAASYLAGAGVGTIGLCDSDRIELSNLHRQPLYTTADVGRAKVEVALERLEAMNPDCVLLAIPERASEANAAGLVRGWDVVLDCTDSVDARYALSDACAAQRIPLVQAGIGAGESEIAILCGADGPCYRCLHPAAEAAPTCAEEGIVGPVAGAAGSLQALWTLQVITGAASPGRLCLLDQRGAATTVALTRRAGCKAHVNEDGPACPMPWNAPKGVDITVQDFAAHRDDFFLLDVREVDENEEMAIAGGTLIPLGDLPRRLTELPKDRAIVVYCAVGGRSGRAASLLRDRGFNAMNLRGGIRAWMMAGLA